jgi:hypothetical protein
MGARQRFAKLHLPADTDERAQWNVVRTACDLADELTNQRYADIDDQYDDLAAQLLKDPAYQRAGSVGVRKQAAERFLAARADGSCRRRWCATSCKRVPSGSRRWRRSLPGSTDARSKRARPTELERLRVEGGEIPGGCCNTARRCSRPAMASWATPPSCCVRSRYGDHS